jgi:hypothetical protein
MPHRLSGAPCPRVHTAKTLDANTLHPVGQPFRQRFQLGHCLVVRASGLLSEENCHKLDVGGPGYLLGTRIATTQAASGPPCPPGRLARSAYATGRRGLFGTSA